MKVNKLTSTKTQCAARAAAARARPHPAAPLRSAHAIFARHAVRLCTPCRLPYEYYMLPFCQPETMETVIAREAMTRAPRIFGPRLSFPLSLPLPPSASPKSR